MRKFNKVTPCGDYVVVDVSTPSMPNVVCYIDICDIWIVNGLHYGRWSTSHADGNKTYAKAKVLGNNRKTASMHQVILGDAPDGFEIDHHDGNGLNNRRGNIRFATRSQNNANRAVPITKLKGITWHKQLRMWQAQCNGKYLGVFATDVEAATAYDKEARYQFGRYARINFEETA